MIHPWHPYNGHPAHPTPFTITHTTRHHLHSTDHPPLLDGISSWWTAIFGYGHPALVEAVQTQASRLLHVMFAGLTHEPAEQLASTLAELSPATPSVFFSDSGSVAVEIALKMARQYWQALGKPHKQRFLALRNGYHGDTTGAMSVSDPDSLHQQFRELSQPTFFARVPRYGFDCSITTADMLEMQTLLEQNHTNIAAVILEPIWQGAGAMNFYAPAVLTHIRQLCDTHQVLLIVDEIATGFGKTGQLFAYQHTPISPDILCLGKALTGGMMTLAATCTSRHLSDTISQHPPYRLMHGPTYMANPLACSAANASLSLLMAIDWQSQVNRWQSEMRDAFECLVSVEGVNDVRVLGHVGVIEMATPALSASVQPLALPMGVWLRPFNRWVYLTPAYTMPSAERQTLLSTTIQAVKQACAHGQSGNPVDI